MAPRTPRQNLTAGPFITLSLSRDSASKLANSRPDDTVSGINSPVISASKERKLSLKKKPGKRDHVFNRDPETVTLTPVGGRRRLSQTTSPTMSLVDNSLLSFKYSTPSTSQAVSQEDEIDFAKALEKSSQSLANSATKEFPNSSDGQMDRRSSTASLTDTGTRSSGRARKLTSKAQALAGTRFLPSLQASPDIDTAPIQTNNNQVDDQVTHLAEELLPNTPPSETQETVGNETLLESVETAAVRTSARERKPTARAAEFETKRASRKRPASPASPVGGDRAAKFAKKSPAAPSKPSKLRHSAVSVEAAAPEVAVITPKIPEQEPEAVVVGQSNEQNSKSPEVSTAKNIDIDNVVVQPGLSTLSDGAEITDTMNVNALNENKAQQCNLACLSPSSRLLAFAKYVSEWSDSDDNSDDDEDDEIDLDTVADSLESNSLVGKVCQAYCQCRPNISTVKPPVLLSEPTPQSLVELPNGHKCDDESILPIGGTQSLMPPSDVRPAQESVSFSDRKSRPTNSKRQKDNDKKPDLKKQDSSFERRMQTDFLANLREKAAGLQDQSKRLALAVTQKERRKTAPPNTKSSPRILRHRASNIGHANGLGADSFMDSEVTNNQATTEDARLPNNHSFVTLKMAKRDKSPNSSEKRLQSEHTANSVSVLPESREKSTMANNASKKTQATDTIDVQETRKSASGGSVRASLNDNIVSDRVPMIKEHTGVAPPRTKSIKLRFTTMAKGQNTV